MAVKIKEKRTVKIKFLDSTGDMWEVELYPLSTKQAERLQSLSEGADIILDGTVVMENLVSIHSTQIDGENLTQNEKKEILKHLPADVLTMINIGALKVWNETVGRFLEAEKNSGSPSN